MPKEGGRFDLPIALGILLASQQLTLREDDPPREFYGELALSGELKPVKGLLLAAAHAARDGHAIVVPRANAEEARIAARDSVCGAAHLLEICDVPARKADLAASQAPHRAALARPGIDLDLRDVRGQAQAKRALAIAAAGEHSLLMIGPPGAGKSMLAQRLAGLLPPLSPAEALEVATIASVSSAGFDPRPLRAAPLPRAASHGLRAVHRRRWAARAAR